MDMIGRREEQEELLEAYHSGKPEFIALYGRRRVGKTFLVRSLFEKEFAFHVTGMANSGTRTQLDNFREALADYGHACGSGLADWREAFHELRLHLEKINRKRKIVFIDEMPWMDTPRSGFLQALEHFWNGWASAQSDILMIVCGSAAAWIVKHLFKNRGGLHNRLTKRILLNPFQLKECEEYFRANGIGFTQSQVMEAYMVFGGIPYYLSLLSGKYSVVQNVDRLCFRSDGALRNEFEELYASLYKNAERHVLIVKTLGGKKKGMAREEIVKASKIPNGGSLTEILKELELSGFIRKYQPFSKKTKGALYQLVDHFSLFHFAFIQGSPEDAAYWQKTSESPRYKSWRGYAFEQVCLSHIKQIRRALSIDGIINRVSSWQSERSAPGVQIDLLIERNDGVVSLCEMRYKDEEYELTNTDDKELRMRRNVFLSETGCKKAVQIVFLTPVGLKRNAYYETVQAVVTGGDLFG